MTWGPIAGKVEQTIGNKVLDIKLIFDNKKIPALKIVDIWVLS